MTTAARLVKLAEDHIGERYLNILVPKDNPNWTGPWDCAEFASWLVYQIAEVLYGCIDDTAAPSIADAYSGAWVRDAQSGALLASTVEEATNTPGVILIRRPPMAGAMGHVAISDGFGRTVEAAGMNLGVRKDKVQGRLWHLAAKVPELSYSATGHVEAPVEAPFLLTLETPNIEGPLVRKVQQALRAQGYDPGRIDGQYGPHTVAAVTAFQFAHRLVPDGVCGPRTAKKLGVNWQARA